MAYINFRGKKIKPSKPDHPTILKATHLAEFHQIEGFVADRRASQGRLKVPEEKVAQNKNTWIFPKVPQSSIGIPKVPQSSRRNHENDTHILEGSKLMWPECCPCHFLGWDLPNKNNNVAFFGLGFMTRMTPYKRVVWVVFFQKGRSWGCKLYEEIWSTKL